MVFCFDEILPSDVFLGIEADTEEHDAHTQHSGTPTSGMLLPDVLLVWIRKLTRILPTKQAVRTTWYRTPSLPVVVGWCIPQGG